MNSKRLKKAIRERMAVTGESYMAAMHALQRGGDVRPVVIRLSPGSRHDDCDCMACRPP